MKSYLISMLLVAASVLSFASLTFAEDASVPTASDGVQIMDEIEVSGPVFIYNQFAGQGSVNTYIVKLKGATYFTVSAGDCCDTGDTYSMEATRKKPAPKQTETSTFGTSIANTCAPPISGYEGEITLNDPKKVVVKVKASGIHSNEAHGTYLKFDSDGTMKIKTKGSYCGVCCSQ